MSSFRPNRRSVVLALLALSACGYRPAYAPIDQDLNLPAQIAVASPNDNAEFLFVQQLERRLGRPATPQFRLRYEINTSRDGIGVNPEQEVFRNSIVGKVTYSLLDASSGAVVANGSVDSFVSYSVGAVDPAATPPRTNATIATLAAQRDAESRLMAILADLLVTRLIATSETWNG